MFCKPDLKTLLFLFKSVIFLSLTAYVYIHNFTEVLEKYEEGYTNIATSHETLDNGMKPPFITICFTPWAKQSILDKYNMTTAALNEPNPKQKNTLTKLNKTIEDLFMETTFKLNADFTLHMNWWIYEEQGWHPHKHKLDLNDNVFKV